MKLMFLIGSGAVGKMTVGQELTKITDFRLFHNHMTIEPVIEVFGYFNSKAISRMREVVFEEFAASDNYGLIFTYMWAFDQQSDWDYVEHVKEIFKQRNVTENRLKNKASKNNIEASNQWLINDDEKYRIESLDGEVPFENYIKIDNSDLSPEDTARKIKEYFNL